MKTRDADCQILLERLSAFLDGDLPAPQCRAIEAHARHCDRCTKMIADLRNTIGLCQAAGNQPLPDAVRRRARARVRALMQRPRRPNGRR